MTPLDIIYKTVTDFYGKEEGFIVKKDTNRERTYIRQLFHYISRSLNGYLISLSEIGSFNNNDPFNHATVLYSVKKIQGLVEVDKYVRSEVLTILKKLPSNRKTEHVIKKIERLENGR
jgi:chromosomal replication initiation ATPase DnaA